MLTVPPELPSQPSPMWEVRCNVLVPRMSRNVLRRDLEARHWCVLREDSGTSFGIDYLAAISNSSECAARNPGGAPQVVTILWNAGVQVNPKIAAKVWRPVYLNCRYLFLRRAFDIHRSRSCHSHAGNRSGSCGRLSHSSFEPAKFEANAGTNLKKKPTSKQHAHALP